MELTDAFKFAAQKTSDHGHGSPMINGDGTALVFRATSPSTYVRPERTVRLDGITEDAITAAVEANALDISSGPAAPRSPD